MAERLGIAGSGMIATGLARVAGKDREVVLWARSEASAERARGKVGDAAEVVTDLEGLAGSELVVEAVAEDPEVKREIHGRLGELLSEGAVLATTTSSLSVEEVARASGRPDRFAALHVFSPVEKMKLVELCFPDEASGETRDRLNALCHELGKVAIEVPDVPGFVVNRLLFPYLFSAVRLLDETGLEPNAVDACMQLGAGHPVGPIKLLDVVGLDVAVAIADSIGTEVPDRVRELVAEGKLGRKTGGGLYPPKG